MYCTQYCTYSYIKVAESGSVRRSVKAVARRIYVHIAVFLFNCVFVRNILF